MTDHSDDIDWYGPDMATFGDRLAAARDAAKLSQAQLARRLGVRVSTLRGWEEDRTEPRANRLSMLAGFLNVSIVWLLTGEGDGVAAPDQADGSADIASALAELAQLRVTLREALDRAGRLEKRLRAGQEAASS
ncbi:transcriptional regulator [Mesobacterium pallidum]|uniref:transcriptional regulator n=1 Tax=Mesobacterium pallidum TaxID=2872037 RepID=UPI001EE23252|nr:transcriptional regulator [Mesobacterium pallidum]